MRTAAIPVVKRVGLCLRVLGVLRKVAVLAVLAAVVLPQAAFSSRTSELIMPRVRYINETRLIGGQRVVFHVVFAPKPGGVYGLRPVLSNNTVSGRASLSAMQRHMLPKANVVGVGIPRATMATGCPFTVLGGGGGPFAATAADAVTTAATSATKATILICMDPLPSQACLGVTGDVTALVRNCALLLRPYRPDGAPTSRVPRGDHTRLARWRRQASHGAGAAVASRRWTRFAGVQAAWTEVHQNGGAG